MRPKAHFTAPELLNLTNSIEVCLIGAGGTGLQVLTALARMGYSFQALGHAGFQVSLWDDNGLRKPTAADSSLLNVR
jgi:hypothetical protein